MNDIVLSGDINHSINNNTNVKINNNNYTEREEQRRRIFQVTHPKQHHISRSSTFSSPRVNELSQSLRYQLSLRSSTSDATGPISIMSRNRTRVPGGGNGSRLMVESLFENRKHQEEIERIKSEDLRSMEDRIQMYKRTILECAGINVPSPAKKQKIGPDDVAVNTENDHPNIILNPKEGGPTTEPPPNKESAVSRNQVSTQPITTVNGSDDNNKKKPLSKAKSKSVKSKVNLLDVFSLKVVQLRVHLKKRGLPASGLKAELQLRLEKAVAEENAEAKIDSPEDTKTVVESLPDKIDAVRDDLNLIDKNVNKVSVSKSDINAMKEDNSSDSVIVKSSSTDEDKDERTNVVGSELIDMDLGVQQDPNDVIMEDVVDHTHRISSEDNTTDIIAEPTLVDPIKPSSKNSARRDSVIMIDMTRESVSTVEYPHAHQNTTTNTINDDPVILENRVNVQLNEHNKYEPGVNSNNVDECGKTPDTDNTKVIPAIPETKEQSSCTPYPSLDYYLSSTIVKTSKLSSLSSCASASSARSNNHKLALSHKSILRTPAISRSDTNSSNNNVNVNNSILAAKRKKRLQEMRGKSKATLSKTTGIISSSSSSVTSNKTTTTNSSSSSIIKNIKSYKTTTNHPTTSSTAKLAQKLDTDKRKILIDKQREKRENLAADQKEKIRLQQQQQLMQEQKLAYQAKIEAQKKQEQMMIMAKAKKHAEEEAAARSAAAAQAKLLLSGQKKKREVTNKKHLMEPLDTYEMSDRDDDSDEETDEEDDRPKKRIPKWARSANLNPALEKQCKEGPDRIDPDSIFHDIESCNLEEIFDAKKARYQRRTSSGNWTEDRVTIMEKLVYKRDMGFQA